MGSLLVCMIPEGVVAREFAWAFKEVILLLMAILINYAKPCFMVSKLLQ